MDKNFINTFNAEAIFKDSPFGICIIDNKKTIIDINSLAKKYFGAKSKSEIIGEKYYKFIPHAFQKQALSIFNSVAKLGKSKCFELKIINKKNQELWFDCKLSVIKKFAANKKYFIHYIRDISEKKEIEEYLLNEKQKFEELYENLSIGLYRTTIKGDLIFANAALAKLFGFQTIDQLYKKDFKKLLKKLNYPRKQFINEIKKKKKILGFEVCIQLPNGEKKYIRENARLIYDKQKNIIGVEGSAEDITDKVLMTNKIKESEESYRGLFNSIKEAVYIQDRQGKFIDINDGAVKMYGYPKKFFIGQTPAVLAAPNKNDFLKLTKRIEKAFQGIPQEFEFWGRRKDGEIFPKNVRLYKGKYFGQDVVIALAQDVSERYMFIETLKASGNQYKSLFESNPHPMWIYDIQTLKFLDVNNSAINHYGYSREEFLKMTIKDIRPKEDVAELLEDLQKRTHKFSFSKVYRHIKKNGNIIFVEISSHPIEYFGKKAELILSYDVTERIKSTEQILKLSQAVEQSSAMILITDKFGKIEYVNKKFTDVTGYTLSDVIDRSPKFLKYNSGASSKENIWEYLLRGESWKGEFVNKKLNGEKYFVSALISPIFDKNSNIISYLAIEEDITLIKSQQKKIERFQKLISGFGNAVEKLLTVEDFEQSIIETLEILSKAFEADRGYIFENSFNKITGDLLMNQIYEWVDEGVEPQINNPMLQGLSYKSVGIDVSDFEKGKILNLIVRELEGDARIVLEMQGIKSLVLIPISVNSSFWGYIGFDNCREEMKWDDNAKEIMKAISISIGRAIERELTKNELISAKNEAQKADKLKTEFLAQISHEIRSPLNIILNYSSLLKEYFDDKDDPDVLEMFNGIANSGNRIIRTIDLILNLAELQTGSYDFIPKELDLFEDILQLLIVEYKNNAKKKNIELNYSLNTKDAKVIVDEYSITQVFANLLDNAIKYTEKGEINVRIFKNDDKKLSVEIEDTGIGISEEYLPNLFKPFRQEEQGYSRKYEGNGLGLSLVKKYCELNNAEIQVKSKKGKGTKFTVIFF